MKDVAKIDLPYVQAITDRHGVRRYYFRRAGFSRVTLPGDPASEAFAVAYQAALDEARPRTCAPAEGPRSIAALFGRYYLSPEFTQLSPVSRRTYRQVLERFRAKHGHRSAVQLRRKHLTAIFSQMGETPAAASNLRKRLIKPFDLAVELGWIERNPVRATKPIRLKSPGFTPWSEVDIQTFEQRWPAGTRQRLALALLLYTGQRRANVVAMGRQHLRDDRISVATVKTGKRLWIKIHPALRAEIDAHPATSLAFLTTQYGLPFSPAGFTNWFVEQARKAGLEGRTPHGLRKAQGRRLAEAGCSAHEIGAILGHESLEMVEHYTRDADQARLADAGIDRLVETGRERRV